MPPDHRRVPGTRYRQSAQDVHQEVTGRYRGQFPFQLRDDQLLPPLQQSPDSTRLEVATLKFIGDSNGGGG